MILYSYMQLITNEIKSQLSDTNLTGENAQTPICKFFNPCGAQTWLIFAQDHDYPDILWAAADLGFGCVEYGTISLSELLSIKLPFGLKIERDIHFKPKKHADGSLWQLGDYLNLEKLAGI